MSDVRIVKFDDLPSVITKEGDESQQQVKIILEEDGKSAVYTIEFTRSAIPF